MSTAIYMRVSSDSQTTAAQEADLERWAQAQEGPVEWYTETGTGTKMSRPVWGALEAAMWTGQINRLVVWRLDRLGRTASGLTRLFDDLRDRGITLVSLREGLDLSTPAGRLMAGVIASVAQYETEVRSERQRAGIAAARAAGKRWGGSKPGRQLTLTDGKRQAILDLLALDRPITQIAEQLGVARSSVYAIKKLEVR